MSEERRPTKAAYIPHPMGTMEDLALGQSWSPYINMAESGNSLVIVAELPGVAVEDVALEVKSDMLVLRGHKGDPEQTEKRRYYCMERSRGSFYREIILPFVIDIAGAKAVLQDGLLEITLKRMEDRRGRLHRIPIQKSE